VVNISVGKKSSKKRQLKAIEPQGSSKSVIKSRFNDERMGGCIFTVDGITFGLEVCVDHAQRRLANQCGSIQVLLIPAYGQQIYAGDASDNLQGMYCKPKGIVFNVDGQSDTIKDAAATAEVQIRDGTAAKQAIADIRPSGIDGSLAFFGPFQLPPKG
jgi:hypothetical protein